MLARVYVFHIGFHIKTMWKVTRSKEYRQKSARQSRSPAAHSKRGKVDRPLAPDQRLRINCCRTNFTMTSDIVMSGFTSIC